jgi:hypothetical protein
MDIVASVRGRRRLSGSMRSSPLIGHPLHVTEFGYADTPVDDAGFALFKLLHF